MQANGPSPATHTPEAAGKPRLGSRVISTGPAPLCIEAGALVVPPLRRTSRQQTFVNPLAIRIPLAEIAPGRYRVVLVQNFQVEDRNPNLAECIAGVFLAARRADGSWEEPERFPVECRAIAVLGELDRAP